MSDDNTVLEGYLRTEKRKGHLLARAIVVLNAALIIVSFVSALLVG